MTSARVLILAPFPREAAYTRYRLLQFVPDLAVAGIEARVVPFLTSNDFRGYYGRATYASRTLRLACAVGRRVVDAVRAARYDAMLVGREALLFGPPWIETFLTRVLRRPLAFDFDDAIFLPNPNTAWGRWSGLAARFKCPGKTDAILKASTRVLAGNSYLAEHARRFNQAVTVLPTVVDPDDYPDATRRTGERTPVLGWVGTHTTAAYLEQIAGALAEVASRKDFRLRLVGAGAATRLPGVAVESVPWTLEREFDEFAGMDIGLYPLPDTPWSRGKCGFKAIQYLAAGVPAICSPVGVTTEIVEHGQTGLFATSQAEWVAALERLLDDAAERHAMGALGRTVVRERWSRQAHAPSFVQALQETAECGGKDRFTQPAADGRTVTEPAQRPPDRRPATERVRG